MATANKFLEQPARGSNVGVWDTPVNYNTGVIDNSFGGVATIGLLASNVVLSSAQYQCTFIVFTGAITANCAITFPAVGSFYTIVNQTTNSSAFIVTLTTTAAGGQVVGLPPGVTTDIFTDGTNVRYRSISRVGSYFDYAGSSNPLWNTACTIPPYLVCDGTTFSSATYPALSVILGGNTLPDTRGRFRATLNSGTGRITSGSSTGGIDGNTAYASGGSQTVTLSSQNMPNYALPVTDPGHSHGYIRPIAAAVGTGGGLGTVTSTNQNTDTATTGISVNSGGLGANFSNLPPAYVGGITLIRAG